MHEPAPLPQAYAVYQDFAPAPASPFLNDRHYLLYAASGTMRLEAEGRSWTLPPARAALIAAGKEITVALLTPVRACSVLFDPGFVPPPPAVLSVFEMTPLARELVLECGQWGKEAAPLSPYATQMFAALSQAAWRLATTPSTASMPLGKSDAVRKAVSLTETQLAGEPSFDAIAAAVAMSPRSLARHFSQELGMTWSQALRRQRMIRAIEALASTPEPVTQIAFSVGYSSVSAFNAAFRDFTGLAPTDYRRSFLPGS